jgi:hypothetical protein
VDKKSTMAQDMMWKSTICANAAQKIHAREANSPHETTSSITTT